MGLAIKVIVYAKRNMLQHSKTKDLPSGTYDPVTLIKTDYLNTKTILEILGQSWASTGHNGFKAAKEYWSSFF